MTRRLTPIQELVNMPEEVICHVWAIKPATKSARLEMVVAEISHTSVYCVPILKHLKAHFQSCVSDKLGQLPRTYGNLTTTFHTH
jgi:hypothetical protein